MLQGSSLRWSERHTLRVGETVAFLGLVLSTFSDFVFVIWSFPQPFGSFWGWLTVSAIRVVLKNLSSGYRSSRESEI